MASNSNSFLRQIHPDVKTTCLECRRRRTECSFEAGVTSKCSDCSASGWPCTDHQTEEATDDEAQVEYVSLSLIEILISLFLIPARTARTMNSLWSHESRSATSVPVYRSTLIAEKCCGRPWSQSAWLQGPCLQYVVTKSIRDCSRGSVCEWCPHECRKNCRN